MLLVNLQIAVLSVLIPSLHLSQHLLLLLLNLVTTSPGFAKKPLMHSLHFHTVALLVQTVLRKKLCVHLRRNVRHTISGAPLLLVLNFSKDLPLILGWKIVMQPREALTCLYSSQLSPL